MQIHAWLEEREIRGLDRAFRGQLTSEAVNGTVGVGSLSELHQALDRILHEAGLIDERENREQP